MPKKYHNRQSTRLKGYDYSSPGRYFITIITRNRIHLFGKIEDGAMKLNHLGKIARDEWNKTLELRPNVSLGEFVIMPDHIHLVFYIDEQLAQPKLSIKDLEKRSGAVKGRHIIKNHSVSTIIRGYKAAVTKQIKDHLRHVDIQDSQGLNVFSSINLSKSIWLRGYHDIIIRNDRAYKNITQYIIDNPRNW